MRNVEDQITRSFKTFAKFLLALVIVVLVAPPVTAAVAVGTLLEAPLPVGDLPEKKPQIRALPSTVFDSEGQEIGVFRGFDQSLEIAPEDIPDIVKNAFIAIEDRRFWEHNGVDLEGIGRAARANLEAGGVAQGGSTITQQYIKNAYLSDERTLERKVEEALLAVELEKQLSKEEILFGYLTTSYYGSGAYGIGAAAEIYFGKSVSELDASEAAVLAGLVKAPTSLDPTKNLEASEARRRLVIEAMSDQGYLTEAQRQKFLAKELWYLADGTASPEATIIVERKAKGSSQSPFFVDWIESVLLEELGDDLVYRGGLTIETTLDTTLQTSAETAVAARLENTDYPVEMSLVSVEPETGFVKAMVGGRDYSHSQLNLATGGSTGFQPGSSFKPIVLAAAFSMGMNPDTLYPAPARWAAPGCTGDNCYISNYAHSGYGDMTLRAATAASVNTVYAQLVSDVTISDTVTLGRKLGISRLDPEVNYGVSLSLGAAETSPLEMASVYGTFANEGQRLAPTGIIKVTDADGNVLIDNRLRAGEKVLEPIVANNVTDVLTAVVEGGTGARAQIGRPVAGKTGTAQSYSAAWFVGYTPQLSTAVWMGHADGLKPLKGVNGVGSVTGGSHPAIAWRDFMSDAHEGVDVEEFPEPGEIVPLADNAAEIVTKSAKKREFTVAGVKQSPNVLQPACGSRSCEENLFEAPSVPKPQVPTTAAPVTVAPTSVDASADESATTKPSTTKKTTTTAKKVSSTKTNTKGE